ncbi:MAG TPA: Crp/Fnr family transcriptional regulator [Candidatus Limnocylindria bacterium]|nr:Crp/Fnr family transcriptional regulator [Candidatus Limnocylindria bacterium]
MRTVKPSLAQLPLGNRILEALPEAARDTMLEQAKRVRLGRGQVEMYAGMALGHVDFPASALLSSVVHYEDGSAREVAIIGRSGFLPIEPLVSVRRARRTVYCRIEGEAVRVPLEAFESAVAPRGLFADLVQRFLGARLFAAEELVACNLTHGLLQRCARWLLTARDGIGGDVFAITHENLALMLGVHRPSVSEALAVLQTAGAITPRRGEISVVDAARLESFSCECYAAVRDEFERVFAASSR